MKVFHGPVNFGTQSGYHSRELRKIGIEADSVTRYDPFDRVTDVPLKHSGKNLFQKVYNYIWNQFYLLRCFFKYDVFHFYAGKTLTKYQWDLPFYGIFGKKIVFEYLGIDVQKYQYSVENFKYTNIVYRIDKNQAEQHDRAVDTMLKRHDKHADLKLVCAPCYAPFVPDSIVLPLGIDLGAFTYTPKPAPKGKVKIMHAPTHRGNKGTAFILDAVERLKAEKYPIEMMLVEDVPHQQLKSLYIECDLFVDQVMSGWYGTASIEAMALGRPVVCNIQPEFFRYIDYGDRIPIVHADPDTIYDELKKLIEHKEQWPELGRQCRKFVEEIHDLKKNTRYLSTLYHKVCENTNGNDHKTDWLLLFPGGDDLGIEERGPAKRFFGANVQDLNPKP